MEPDGTTPAPKETPAVTTAKITPNLPEANTTAKPVVTTVKSVETTAAPNRVAVTLIGDANCDGKADVSDAVLIARIAVEDKSASISSQGIANGDCNKDGSLTPDDIVALLRHIAKIEILK